MEEKKLVIKKDEDIDTKNFRETNDTVIYSILNFFEVSILTIGWLCIKLYYFIDEKTYKESLKDFIDGYRYKKKK